MRNPQTALGKQSAARVGLFLNFCGNLAPDFFASQIAAPRKLFCALFDFLVRVETVMRPAKSRIHDNGIFMRRPHAQTPPQPTLCCTSLTGTSQSRQDASRNYDRETARPEYSQLFAG